MGTKYYRSKMSGVIIDSDESPGVFSPDLWEHMGGGKKAKAEYVQQSKDALHELLKPDTTIYVNIKNISRSGMTRLVTLHYINTNSRSEPALRNITHAAAVVMDWKMRDDMLVVEGAGMDMAWHTVDVLSRALEMDLDYEVI